MNTPQLTRQVEVRLHRVQQAFRRSQTTYRGFVGGRGAGKTWIGAYDMLVKAQPGRTYLVGSPTGIILNDTTLPTFRKISQDLGLVNWRISHMTPYPTVVHSNGATIRFRTAEDPDRMRGPNLSGVWLDEASLMKREAYEICIAALREGGQQGWLSATFTPKGQANWTWEVFSKEPRKSNTELFKSRTRENPFLPPEFHGNLLDQYRAGSRLAEQELNAEFLADSMTLFSRGWFKILPAPPPMKRKVRAWDLAATEIEKGKDPDFTVGALIGVTEEKGTVIASLIRERLSPLQTKQLIKNVAGADGRNVEIIIEQEPGASAKILVADLIRELAGWIVRAEPANGTKAERASPLSSHAESGAVSLVAAPWINAFLDEAEQFPGGKHDDQVDAVAMGFNYLHKKPDYRGVL